jgi:probable phosphoglycerate mutase
VLAVRWIGLPVIEGQHFRLGTASLSVFSNEPERSQVHVIERWNA